MSILLPLDGSIATISNNIKDGDYLLIPCIRVREKEEIVTRSAKPGATTISRASSHSYGSAAMIGCYSKGWKQSTVPSAYKGNWMDNWKLRPKYVFDFERHDWAYNQGYPWDWRQYVRTEADFGVVVWFANPDWYKGSGYISIYYPEWFGSYGYIHKAFNNSYTRPGYNYTGKINGVVGKRSTMIKIPSGCDTWTSQEWIQFMNSHLDKFTTSLSMPASNQIMYHAVDPQYRYDMYDFSYLHHSGIASDTVIAPPNVDTRLFNEQIHFQSISSDIPDDVIVDLFIKVIDDLPTDDMNWIATTLDCVHAIIAIVEGNVGSAAKASSRLAKVAKTASSAWLSYRYVYTTTKHDAESFKTFRSRVSTLKRLLESGVSTTTARASCTYKGATVSLSCQYAISDVMYLNSFLGYCNRMLLYDTWDLIPFSFIVDWFYSVGDLLHDASLHSVAMTVKPVTAWVSVSYSNDTKGMGTVKRYFRYPIDGVPRRPPKYDYFVARDATTLSRKRSADALSLIVGLL